MTRRIAFVVGWIAVQISKPIAAMLSWAEQNMEDTVAGAKEKAAREALEKAIEKVEAWQAAEDETDATELSRLTARLDSLTPAVPSHLPVDQSGNPVDPNANPAGPAAPETSAPTDDAPVTETEGTDVER